jgi:hypothetical protein
MYDTADDGSSVPHGLLLLDVEADAIVGFDAFIEGWLVALFEPA